MLIFLHMLIVQYMYIYIYIHMFLHIDMNYDIDIIYKYTIYIYDMYIVYMCISSLSRYLTCASMGEPNGFPKVKI